MLTGNGVGGLEGKHEVEEEGKDSSQGFVVSSGHEKQVGGWRGSIRSYDPGLPVGCMVVLPRPKYETVQIAWSGKGEGEEAGDDEYLLEIRR